MMEYNQIIKQKKFRKKIEIKEVILYITIGLLSGAICGLFGGGGGSILVPFLVFFMAYDQKEAQATALSLMLPVCLISAFSYYIQGIFDIKNTLFCGGGSVSGGLIGACLLSKLNSKIISIIFYFLMIAGGIKTVLS